jgi:hypothetical protein
LGCLGGIGENAISSRLLQCLDQKTEDHHKAGASYLSGIAITCTKFVQHDFAQFIAAHFFI